MSEIDDRSGEDVTVEEVLNQAAEANKELAPDGAVVMLFKKDGLLARRFDVKVFQCGLSALELISILELHKNAVIEETKRE